jgi:hypothetical protein
VGDEGLEPDSLTGSSGNDLRKSTKTRAAKSGAFVRQNGATKGSAGDEIDPDLAAIVEAWPNLPQPLRAAVLAIVGSVKGNPVSRAFMREFLG